MTDELTLKVGNKLIQGWGEIRVTRGIERLPSDFDLSLMDHYPGSDGEELVRKGDPCQVMLGDDLVMTGYIDRWNPALSKSRHEIRATGRGKCQDLVDCSAEWPNNVISQANALQIAQRLAAPYDINVSSDVEDMATVPQFTLNWGESSQEVIDRISRWAALLYFDTPDGNLLLTRVGTRKAASGVAQGENIEYASFTDSMDERFSDYIGVSMSTTPVAEFSPNAGYDAVTLARARDPEAAKMRYRNRVIIVESTMIATQQAQNCIDWEMNRRFGRSRQLQVTVDSWRDKSGKLWEPNTLIPISLPIFGLKDELWILAEVTFMRGEQGTTARMVLMPPAAFAVQPYAFYRQLQEVN
ncbi:phage tail protein [Serratia fonticola]|uniref:phage baseplate assembly protein n=1 Tax=Serratia TaxID=613 RepID=UPI001AE1FB5D|nr:MULTISPECIES: contractile injection system protein, VgrG/Pvc8 family [Serratia]MBP1034242.1 phage tail protein [Serratia fonticola]UAN52223.1 phage tail protein [Serratia sp. JSRIV002]